VGTAQIQLVERYRQDSKVNKSLKMATKDIGVVVVGLGIAGKVRIRDLQENTCGLKLKGVVSRRPVDLKDVKVYSIDEAVKDSDVQAVIISTEPCTHEEYAEKALENGKHVLVEYPVALSSAKAKQLFKLAEEKGLVLREENIALLTASYLEVQKKSLSTAIESASYSISGKFNNWIEDFKQSGQPFITGVSGLQVMISMFGPLTAKSASISYEDDGYTTKAELVTQQDKPITMALARHPGAARVKEEVYTFTDGVLDFEKLHKATVTKPGLFMQDMHLFYQRIEAGKLSEQERDLTISSLELAEKIHSFY